MEGKRKEEIMVSSEPISLEILPDMYYGNLGVYKKRESLWDGKLWGFWEKEGIFGKKGII
jgi:hypothetical protein